MKRLLKYQQERAAILEKMEAISATADAETNGDLTEDQTTAYAEHRADLDKAKGKIGRAQAEEEEERSVAAVQTITPRLERTRLRADDDAARGFTRPVDYLALVQEYSEARTADAVADERMKALIAPDEGPGTFMLPLGFHPESLRAAAGSDEQGEYDDGYGGTLVRRSYQFRLLEVGFEGDPTAGRTQMIPMTTPKVGIPARTDKDHSTSVTGGLTVFRRAETAAAKSSRGEMEMVNLDAAMLMGLSYATEELLADSPISFAAILESGYRTEFAARVLREKIRGLGGDEFLGILTALAATSLGPTLAFARATASQIAGADIATMRSRAWGYGQAIWLANHDIYNELLNATIIASDGGASPVGGIAVRPFQASLLEDRPDTLLGRPIFFTEYASTLGSAGDLICANFSQFLEGVYQREQSAESMHVRFENHERAFKFWLRNAGAPWWRTALTPNQSSTTLSPFVILGDAS